MPLVVPVIPSFFPCCTCHTETEFCYTIPTMTSESWWFRKDFPPHLSCEPFSIILTVSFFKHAPTNRILWQEKWLRIKFLYDIFPLNCGLHFCFFWFRIYFRNIFLGWWLIMIISSITFIFLRYINYIYISILNMMIIQFIWLY